MKKLSIKSIVEFRSKSDRCRKNFVNTLKSEKVKIDMEGGGDYWVTSLSAIRNSFKLDDLQPIIDKRTELAERYKETEYKRTKAMYKRNMDILYNYKDYKMCLRNSR